MSARAHPASLSIGWPLAGLGVLVLLTLVAVGTARLAGGASPSPSAADTADAFGAVLAVRRLHFRDRADGGIDVLDAGDGSRVGVVEPGSQGFVRGALRGLAQERKRRGLGAEAPFELSARAGGALVLADPATGRRVELASFGPVNAGAFARWLPLKEARP